MRVVVMVHDEERGGKMNKPFTVIIVLCCLFLIGCASENERARIALENKNIPYTDEDFIEQVGAGNLEAVKLFIKAGKDVNTKDKYGRAPLHLAGDIEVAKFLLSKGADVNTKDNTRWTSLNYACCKDQKELVKLLLSKGADINTRDNDGITPLQMASTVGYKEIIGLLKAHGARERPY
ncbi:MAG: ankyrin repeat domain-containing protein [Candidatus Eremiobacteraeota bacterium]|nr:ankyrin repeat domain-containing protein [Candidatus Eremiobacteraeota bacterium]